MNEHLEEKIKERVSAMPSPYLENIRLFNKAIETFLNYNYLPYTNEKLVIWQNGSSYLQDFGKENKDYKEAILFIPSFINKPYILDLTPDTSILDFFNGSDFHPFLLDWGKPELAEINYTYDEYIVNRLVPAVNDLLNRYSKVSLVGYCLGGMAGLAYSQLFPGKVSNLVLLATPWDFSHFVHNTKLFDVQIEQALALGVNIPSSYLRAFFYLLLPFEKTYKKFISFLDSINDIDKSELFVAVERWAMDDMYISRGVFNECYNSFILNNSAQKGLWEIGGCRIIPEKTNVRTLIASPLNDNIVPPSSTVELREKIKAATVLLLNSGHIGMIVGSKRKEQLWQPLLNWLKV